MTPHDHDQTHPRLDELLGELARRDRHDLPSSRVERAVMAQWADAATHPEVSMPSVWPAAGVAFALSAAAAWVFVAVIDRPHEDFVPAAATVTDVSSVTPSQMRAPDRAPVAREDPVAVQAETAPVSEPVMTPRSAPPAPDRDLTAEPPAVSDTFVALSQVAAQDLGAVRMMRVRLPGAAVRTLGLEVPVPTVQEDGFVQADVLLGEDGVARAIRLLP